jgi:RNA polymerase sigma-70 factor (ECF subfamily)
MTKEDLIRTYQGFGAVVYRRCRQILGNEQDSRDASQEVFERCLRQCERLRTGPELLAWLYRVSTNLCLDRLRRRRDGEREPLSEQIPSLDAIGESRLLDRDSVRRLLAAVAPRTREVAVYLYVDGMSQQEIARLGGMTDRSVRNHVARLRDAAIRLGLRGESS